MEHGVEGGRPWQHQFAIGRRPVAYRCQVSGDVLYSL
jgi:hypothetical protein